MVLSPMVKASGKLLLAFLSALAAFSLSAPLSAQTLDVDYAVAFVNSRKITKSQVEARLALITSRTASQFAAPPTFDQALQFEINRTLLLQAADREIDSQTKDRLRQVAGLRLAKPADPKVFTKDPTEKEIDDYYRDLLVSVYLDRKLDADAVTPADVKAYYDGHRDLYTSRATVAFRQILIRQDKRTADDARLLAEKAAARLAAGEDFAALAREISEGPYASEGGLWPPQRRGQLIPQMEAVVFSTKPGEASQPFPSPLGWHIVKVENSSPESPRPYAEVQQDIYQQLVTDVRRQTEQKLIENLRSKAIITILGA